MGRQDDNDVIDYDYDDDDDIDGHDVIMMMVMSIDVVVNNQITDFKQFVRDQLTLVSVPGPVRGVKRKKKRNKEKMNMVVVVMIIS